MKPDENVRSIDFEKVDGDHVKMNVQINEIFTADLLTGIRGNPILSAIFNAGARFGKGLTQDELNAMQRVSFTVTIDEPPPAPWQYDRKACTLRRAELQQIGLGLGAEQWNPLLAEEADLIDMWSARYSSSALLIDECHTAARNGGWWNDPVTGEPIQRDTVLMLMLMVSEIAEGFEGYRKGLNDDKLPHRPMLEVELADLIIRACDMAAGLGLDVPGALVEKMEYNRTRADHKPENRVKEGGKKF